MHLVNVNCSNCGELLSIPESVKLATCKGCEMPLVIKQTDSVTFTEPMLLARPEYLAVVPFEEKKTKSNKLELPNEKILEIITEEESKVENKSVLMSAFGYRSLPVISEEAKRLIELKNANHTIWKKEEGAKVQKMNMYISLGIVLVILTLILFLLKYLQFPYVL